MGGHDHLTNHCTNPAKCVNCGKGHLSRSSDCAIWKKEKEIMKLKVIKNLTYPEARKFYDQQQPEFTFAKVVQSLSLQSQKPKQLTLNTMLKTPKSQEVQKLLSQKSRNHVLNLHHRQQPVHNRRPVRKTKRIYHQINHHQDNQTH